jgi:hypothetical protein
MFYADVISSFESEVASPKIAQIFSQEKESLCSLRISPKHSAHSYAMDADYNPSSKWLTYHGW